MVSWKRLLAVSAVSLAALCQKQGSAPKCYDSPGGLNECFLNAHFSERFNDKEDLEYLANTDRIEKEHYFEPMHHVEGNEPMLFTLIAEKKNEIKIYEITNASKDSLTPEERRLRDLLDELDEISRKTPDKGKLLGLLHDRINSKLSIGISWLPYMEILAMLGGQVGDCNDISAVHASIYAYYGFETEIRYGYARAKSNNISEPHVWLEVKLPEGIVDIDPTWYRQFAPLESRSGEGLIEGLNRINGEVTQKPSQE